MPAAKKTPSTPTRHRVFGMPYTQLHAAWLNKVVRKGRTEKELVQVICWLTGYTPASIRKDLKGQRDLGDFLDQSPAFNPAAKLITGTICGVRVEAITDPLMRRMRQLDKLVDELAKGRPMEKILRA